MRHLEESSATEEVVRAVGLFYASDEQPGIRRRKAGTGFSYRNADGVTIKDRATLKRIHSLVIPPAWRDVWICPAAEGHLQVTGRDEKGRKQYLYHPGFREVRDSAKFAHMLEFAAALPAIRATVEKHMALPGLPREKVLATTVHLLETTLIRVGNDDYAKQNGSYGLTTLRDRHMQVEGSDLRFRFKGKSGKTWRIDMRDRRVAKILKACQDLPGQQLLQYQDETGVIHDVTSSDVNAYLKQITGTEITAKDFRTWAGTVLTTGALRELGASDNQSEAKKNITTVIKQVAAQLGNTVAICRKCYVHPDVLDAYLEGSLIRQTNCKTAKAAKHAISGLKPEEAAVIALMQNRLSKA